VKRHNYIDDFNGERYPGIASNYLCDLMSAITSNSPAGWLSLPVPANRKASG
jgi:ferredoxin--NADP+ reductase